VNDLSEDLKNWIDTYLDELEPGTHAVEDVTMLLALKGEVRVTGVRNGELIWTLSEYAGDQQQLPEAVRQVFLLRVYELCCMRMFKNHLDGSEMDPLYPLLLALTGSVTLLGVTRKGELEYRQKPGRWVAGRRIGDNERSGESSDATDIH
jgi:hypothetical protein